MMGTIVLASLLSCHPLTTSDTSPIVSIRGHSFNVEIADTEAERELGLMNRASLPVNAGMLFVFDSPDYYAFYMKNTLIPLDLIWIGPDKKVGYIVRHANPLDETDLVPTMAAKWVLEVNAGVVTQDEVQVGDSVTIP